MRRLLIVGRNSVVTLLSVGIDGPLIHSLGFARGGPGDVG
jgi:hypothetical protein